MCAKKVASQGRTPAPQGRTPASQGRTPAPQGRTPAPQGGHQAPQGRTPDAAPPPGGDDWRSKLESLNRSLTAQERSVQQEKAAVLAAFRKRLVDLQPVLENVVTFGDAFGVDCDWTITRFDERYPAVRFRIHKPALEYEAICRDGVIAERLKEGKGPVKESVATVDDFRPKRFEEKVTAWVQAAANANRKVW